MKKLSKNDIEFLLAGNSWFATGGGFPVKKSLKIFEEILNSSHIFLKSLNEFEDDELLCVSSGVGSGKTTNIDIAKNSSLAISIIQKLVKSRICGIVAGETGLECIAANTASKIKVPIVDTDMKGGRAAPEPSINMFNLARRTVTPAIAINTNDDISILYKVSNPQNIETFLRHFANMATGDTLVVWCPRPAREFKKFLIDGTISRSIMLGGMLKRNMNIEKVLTKLSGRIIFEGIIREIKEEKNKGFLIRKILINNSDRSCQIYIKNENLVATINNNPIVTCPDLITILNKDNCLGLHNSELKTGLEVLVIGLPNNAKWHTRRGHKIFSPKHFSLPFPVVRLNSTE